MSYRTTLVLLLVVVLGVLVVVFAPSRKGASETAEPRPTPAGQQPYVLDPAPQLEQIVGLQIERPGQPRLVFARSAKPGATGQMEPWRMLEPLETPTESYLVDNLARSFARLRARSSFVPGRQGAPGLAAAGLKQPLATVTLEDKQGKQYKLEVGKKAALSRDTYVRVAGRELIHVASRDLARELKKQVKDYRAKNLVKFKPDEATRLRLVHAGKSYDLSKGSDGEWVINQPVKAYADKSKIRSLLSRLGGLRVEEFVEDQPAGLAGYGLEQPLLTIRVTTQTKRALPRQSEQQSETQPAEPKYETVTETRGLAIGGYADLKNEKRFARLLDKPWVVSVPERSVRDLLPKLDEWRDARVTRVKADAATRIELRVAGASARLEKRNGQWQGSGDLAELEGAAVSDLLEAFEDLRAIDYLDEPGPLSDYGLDRPRAVIGVTATGAVAPVVLKIGADTPSGRNTYVQVQDQPTILVVSASQARRLAVPPLSLRSREIFSTQAGQISRIELTRGQARYGLVRQDKQWKLTAPAAAAPDAASVRDLTNDLARLRAKRVVAKGQAAAYGLEEPAVVVRFSVAPGPPTPATTQATRPASAPAPVQHTLRVGRKEGRTYCRKDDDPYVFELDATIWPVFNQELLDRTPFDFQADQVTGLTIAAPGGTLEFGRQDDQWRYLPDPTVRLSQKKVKDFIAELAKLRVESYLAYGDGDLEAAGLAQAPLTVAIRLAEGAAVTLKLEQVRRGKLPRKAAWVEARHIFLLRAADAEKLMRGLDYYVRPEPGAAQQGTD